MRNPLRDEGAAFRLVFVTLGAFALIAIGSAISTWLGVAVTVVLASAGSGLLWRSRQRAGGSEGAVKILVVGAQSPADTAVVAELRRIAGDRPTLTQAVSLSSDPVGAVEAALHGFPADAIVAAAGVDPEAVEQLRSRFVVPITQAQPHAG